MRAITLVNKGGGSVAKGIAGSIGEALSRAGIDSEVILVEGKDCAARAADHVKQGAELIIAAGGDGTMSAVAGELAGSKARMGILPLGTLNHFARDLGIPPDLQEAAMVIAAGHTRAVDIAEVNGRTFVNNASIGLYPLMVVDRDAQRIEGADVAREAVNGRLRRVFGGKGAEQAIPNDQHAAVVAIQVGNVLAVVHAVVRGRVE